jgi:exo-beta-1,3-glucanase (GH17 family)
MRRVVTILLLAILAAAKTTVVDAVPVPIQLYGLNYNNRQGPDWDWNKCKNRNQVLVDLTTLKRMTNRIRILSLVDCGQGELVLDVAKELGMQVWLGLWISEDLNVFEQEKAALQDFLERGLLDYFDQPAVVLGISVGSESIYREDVTSAQNIDYMNQIKEVLVAAGKPDLPVSIVDVAPTYESTPALTAAVDIVVTNAFPFWAKQDMDDATDHLFGQVNAVISQASAQNKQVILGETGWSSQGSNPAASEATPALQTAYFKNFFCKMDKELNWAYYYFTGIDNAWRKEQDDNEDTVEGSFGFYYANLTMKPLFQDLVFTCPGSSVEYSFAENDDTPVTLPTNDPTARPAPSPTISPSPASQASCAANSGCGGLAGNCCPTDLGNFLQCCDSMASPTTTAPSIPPTVSPVATTLTGSPTVAKSTTTVPSMPPTVSPVATTLTGSPTVAATLESSPTLVPTTESPTVAWTASPTGKPTMAPSARETPEVTTTAPSALATAAPSATEILKESTAVPSTLPTDRPTERETPEVITTAPTTLAPTKAPTPAPTNDGDMPTGVFTKSTNAPARPPRNMPTVEPTSAAGPFASTVVSLAMGIAGAVVAWA